MRTRHRNSIAKQIGSLLRSLRTLEESLGRFAPTLSAVVALDGRPLKKIPHRRIRLSAKARASLVLQGRYMGYVRQLKPRQKAKVRKIRAVKGVMVAIKRARELSRA